MAKKKVEDQKISSFIPEKGKKLEEKLNNAIIPVDKQPYKVPKNWCWVKTGSIFSVEYGKELSSKKLIENGYPVFGANGQIGFYDRYMFEYPKALMGCRGTCGVMNLSLPKSFVTCNSLIIDGNNINISAKFIYYLYYALDLKKIITGSVQPQITISKLINFPVPLPPLAEQKRIVNKLDNYISKIDKAKEKLEKVIDTCNYRKNLILHRAFTGQLTKNWRKENKFKLDDDIKKKAITKDSILPDEHLYEIPKNWHWVRLSNIISISKETTDDFSDKKIKYIGLENIEKNGGINSVGDISEVKSLKNVFHKGQILYGKLRPYLNKHDIADFDGVCSTDILVLDSNSNTTNIFVNYYLSDIHFIDYVIYNSRGINLPRITTKILLNASFPLPPIEEQKEIVKILDSVLSKEKQVKEIAEKEIKRVKDLKKNIITRAFVGELGTNNPTEENSIELLKSVL